MNIYFGDKSFHKKVGHLAIPLALQQLLGSAMEMVDSLMVSWIGMVSAVGSASQLILLANTVVWGILSGTNIFAAQFFGAKDDRNLKRSFGFSILLTMLNSVLWITIALLFGKKIILLYIQDPIIYQNAVAYLDIAMFTLIPSGLAFTFSYMYRSIHQASLTLKVSIFSMAVNVLLNSCLIFGLGPFPKMGVQGAALATFIAQSLSLLIYFAHAKITKQPFMGSAHELFSMDEMFIGIMARRITPLVLNEFLFGLGNTLLVRTLATLGTTSIEAYYIGEQIGNFFSFIIWGYGGAVSVIIGQLLGQGKIEQAIRESKYFIGLSSILSLVIILCLTLLGKPILSFYNIMDPVIFANTSQILYVFALRLAFRLFNFMIFSVLRAGGDSKIISILDSGILYVVALPCAMLAVGFNIQSITLVYGLSQLEQVVRFFFGIRRYHSGQWANNLTIS